MTLAANRYRIPCRCSTEVLVGPGQAGGQVVCPACGAGVDVPRLRDLEPFAVIDPRAAPVSGRWRVCHAWLLAGTAAAVLAAAAATIIGARARARPALLPDASMIRAAIDATDAATIHKAWQAMKFSGVDRGTLPEEARLQRMAGMATRVGGLLWLVSAIGAAVAVAAGITCLTGLRPRGDDHVPPAKDGGLAGGARS